MQLGGGVLTPQHLRFLLAGGGLTPQREREVLGGVVSHVLARCPPPRCGVSAAERNYQEASHLSKDGESDANPRRMTCHL